MFSKRRVNVVPGVVLAGLLLVALCPAESAAQNLYVRNESKAPLVIQTAGVIRGTLRRDRPVLLNPNEIAPPIMIPGNKILAVYDAKVPNRVLFQGVIPASLQDQYIAVVPDVPPPKMRIEQRRPFGR